LHHATKDELIKALKRDGITKDNVESHTCLYVEKGIIRASNNRSAISPDMCCGYPNVESIGFWLWMDHDTYENAHKKEYKNISEKVNALFEINLNALKKFL